MATTQWSGLLLVVFFIAIACVATVIAVGVSVFCCKKKNKRVMRVGAGPDSEFILNLRRQSMEVEPISSPRQVTVLEDNSARRNQRMFVSIKQGWGDEPGPWNRT